MITSANYSVTEIAKAIGVDYSGESGLINGLGWNSKEKLDKYCYFVFKGLNYDGIEYVPEAINNGARLIISDRYIKAHVPVLYVEDVRKALCMIAAYHKGKTKIIGVTGSAGKTTTKEMIKAVLSRKYSTIATKDNENNEIGVAKTLLSISDEEFCVIEMGMRKRGDIDFLSSFCNPEASVIINALSAHIGLLGSKDEIFLAKTEILKYTKSYAILPFEDRFLKYCKGDYEKIFVGEQGDISYSNILPTNNGLKYQIKHHDKIISAFIPSFLNHNIYNSLYAYAIGSLYSVDSNEIISSLAEFRNVGLREKREIINGITVILDCYNASYEGMKSSLEGFAHFCAVDGLTPNVILGKMYEIGVNEEEYHYRIGEYARDLGIKDLIAYGSCAKYYTDGFIGGKGFENKIDMAKYIIENYGKQDAILIKAGRADKLEDIIHEMKEILK